jgi:hypothetical protein
MVKIILILLVIKVAISALIVYFFPHILLYIIQKTLIKMDKAEEQLMEMSNKKHPKSLYKKIVSIKKR